MPYLLLFIGVLIALYALYRFLLNANVHQVKVLALSVIIITLTIALFFMAVTGRLPAALALLAAIWPFAWGLWRMRKTAAAQGQAPSADGKPLTREEALEILGLEDCATAEDIKSAYKKLMKKVHPDQEGSEWMAAKLNAAKDLLLKGN